MSEVETIDWKAEQDRFMAAAYPSAVRAARRAFKGWHERKRADAEAEFMAKMWDQWSRLLLKGQDPEPLLWPLIHWAKQWVRYDRRIAGRPRNMDIEDYRAGMTRHLLDGWLDWTGQARTDDPGDLAAALEQAAMTLDEYLAA